MMPDRPDKPTPRAERPMPVICRLKDCVFYEPMAEGSEDCMCYHPHKRLYMRETNCPLYHFDWQKRIGMGKK